MADLKDIEDKKVKIKELLKHISKNIAYVTFNWHINVYGFLRKLYYGIQL
ncbi:MAG: hypothetical protein ACLRW8_01340 [Clostridium cadaveris]